MFILGGVSLVGWGQQCCRSEGGDEVVRVPGGHRFEVLTKMAAEGEKLPPHGLQGPCGQEGSERHHVLRGVHGVPYILGTVGTPSL